jgi:membrane protein implicated in regulation of membrane protease activity
MYINQTFSDKPLPAPADEEERACMETLLSLSADFWLGLGAFLIIFEVAITTPGLGLFLAGIGALCTGLLVKAGVVDGGALGAQVAWFLGLTTFWAAVLWKPLLKFRMQSRHKDGIELNNMVGGTATVGEHGLERGRIGQVAWSGTLMNAELEASAPVETLPAGALVAIKSVSGTTLTVIPK